MNAVIIGTGSICGCHVHALRRCGVEITAVCDIDKQKASRFCEQQKLNCNVYSDWKQMLDSESADVVHICTPHYLHQQMAVYALQKNVSVFSEKPVCISEAELDSLGLAVANSKARYGVCFQNRFLPSNVRAREILSDCRVYSASGSVLWNRDKQYYQSGEWRGKWATEGGGALINQAIHTLDLMLNFTKSAQSVTAAINNQHLQGIIEVEDTADLTLDCRDFTMRFFATTNANASYPVTATFYTDKGVITIIGDKLYVNGEQVLTNSSGEIIGKQDWGAGHDAAIAEFYRTLISGERYECDFDSCKPVMKAVLGAYQSAKIGKTVKLS